MFEITLEPSRRRLNCAEDQTLSEVFGRLGVATGATCGGRGTCGHCAVLVTRGDVLPPLEWEMNTLGRDKVQSGWRLACQTFIRSDVAVFIPQEDHSTGPRLLTEGISSFHGSKTAVPVRKIGIGRMGTGLAVDLGTTKIAAYLVDLKTGETLAQAGRINPQTAYGEDLMARIHHAFKSTDGGGQLRNSVVRAINGLSRQLCDRTGQTTRHIQEAVVVGNTAMHHFLIGLPVRSLGCSPYIPAEINAMEVPAPSLNLNFSPEGNVYFPPNIGGFVGGDHVAMLMGSGMTEKKGVVLGLDIGTNTEISLIVHERHWVCSAASGPAFEGAHIRFGMRSATGAMEKIVIRNKKIEYKTVDGGSPKGLCGSGILDLVAQMLKAGIIDRKGKINVDCPDCRVGINAEPEFVVIPADRNNGLEITFSRGDISEIQLAKAAIRTGTSILLWHAGIHENDIDEVVIAGAFGSYLDIQSGMDIGMLPRIGPEKYIQVGNAAGSGARIMLLSPEKRKKAEGMARGATHVNLASEKDFSSIFARGLMFH
ncbi:MAG: DUF4445 domain-containing protein [Desulfobacteraceae bacterium]|nr:DUF4445 domain-containing protein [Desulfobacteraceae bacterium]